MNAPLDKSMNGRVRMTPQRKAILHALSLTHTHPTARELHKLAHHLLPGISLATVYNSLETLLQAGLVNRHSTSSGAARYCANRVPHAHLVDEESGRMIDVQMRPGVRVEEVFTVPEGTEVSSLSAYLYGRVPSSYTES